MEKPDEPKPQLNVRLPESLKSHINERAYMEGWSAKLQVVAGLVVFEAMDHESRRKAVSVATRAAENEQSWPQFLKAVEGARESLLDEKAVRRLIELLLERIQGGGEVRRRASK